MQKWKSCCVFLLFAHSFSRYLFFFFSVWKSSSSAQHEQNWIHEGNSYVSNSQTKGNKMQKKKITHRGFSVQNSLLYAWTSEIVVDTQTEITLKIFSGCVFIFIWLNTQCRSVNKILNSSFNFRWIEPWLLCLCPNESLII